MPSLITPTEYLRELEATTAPERARLESEELTLEFSQPLVAGFRRKRRRRTHDLPLFDPTQEGLFR